MSTLETNLVKATDSNTALKLKGKGLGVVKIGDFKTLNVRTWAGWPEEPE